MGFPAGLTMITVNGRVARASDATPVGARFDAPYWLTGPTDDAVLAPFTVFATDIEADGSFTVSLPATNDPGWTAAEAPEGWAYRVTLGAGAHAVTSTLTLPYDGGTVDLADRINLDPPPPGVGYTTLAAHNALDARVDALEAAPGGSDPTWAEVTDKPAEITGLAASLTTIDGRLDDLESAPGGASAPYIAYAVETGGNLAATVHASWTILAGFTVPVPAEVGDQVMIQFTGLLDHNAARTDNYEVVVRAAGGGIARYASTGTASPTGAGDGDPSLSNITVQYGRMQGVTMALTVEAGDLDTGAVVFALAHKGAGGGQVFRSATYPLRWYARNDH